MNFAQLYLESAIMRCKEYRALGERTFAQLSDADMQLQPNEASNSIAIIIQHLRGNMISRWTNFLTEDGEKPWRNREQEFEKQAYDKKDLTALWKEGWDLLLETLENLKEEDLGKTIHIRSQPLIVVDAINRQLAHYSYHVGQIVYLGKWIREDAWKSLSIPKGGSGKFNEDMEQSRH